MRTLAKFTLTLTTVAGLLLASLSPAEADVTVSPTFLKIGRRYQIHLASTSFLPWTGVLDHTITVLESAGGDWFLVEFTGAEDTDVTTGKSPKMWLNLAHVVTVSE